MGHQERDRRTLLSAGGSVIAHAVTAGATLISIPISIHYLGEERYGLWMTATSVVMMLGVADLGIWNSAINELAASTARGDAKRSRAVVSTAAALMLAIAFVLLLVFAVLAVTLDWRRLLGVSDPSTAAVMTVLLAALVLRMIGGLAARTQFALQEGYISNAWDASGSVLGVLGLIVAVNQRASLPWVVAAMSAGPLIALACNWLQLFHVRRPALAPRREAVDAGVARTLVRRGLVFFALQIAAMLAFITDNLIISRILGPAAVTAYSVPMKLFGLITMVVSLLLAPLWPAYGDALARGEFTWIRRRLHFSLWATLALSVPPALVLAIWGREIVFYWTRSSQLPSRTLLAGMSVSVILTSLGSAVATFLNGAGMIRFQVACALMMGTAAVIAKVTLGRVFGLEGVVWGFVAAYFFFTAIPVGVHTARTVLRLGDPVHA